MKAVREYCLPCFLELQKTHIIKRAGGRNQKITCWRCKRRRYGTKYEIEPKPRKARTTNDAKI